MAESACGIQSKSRSREWKTARSPSSWRSLKNRHRSSVPLSRMRQHEESTTHSRQKARIAPVVGNFEDLGCCASRFVALEVQQILDHRDCTCSFLRHRYH